MQVVNSEAAPVAGIASFQPLHLRRIFAVGLGNALEFYDFVTFSFFAVQIGHAFFPTSETSHGLLFTLATFGVGFVTRPVGGIVIGRIGDRVGRKAAMMLSFSLMGVAIAALALTPSYAQIGIAAPILLLICRLVQGFAMGGEIGPSTAFLIEVAPPRRRGLYVAMQYATQDLAVLSAAVIGFALSNWLDEAALDAWGWRIALLVGTAVVPVGLVIRRSLPETLLASERQAALATRHRVPARLAVLGFLMLGAGTIGTYVINYMTVYAQDSLHMTARSAFGVTIVTGFSALITEPVSGLLSDRFGRKPVMLGSIFLLLLLVVPSFTVMNQFRNASVLYGASAVLSILQTALSAPVLILITEALPKAIRSVSLATLYAVSIATFGGTTQFAVKWLVDFTGSPMAPAWYMTGALAMGAVAMILVYETSPAKTGQA
jgi:MFS transporter, MHS family, citrate/tricarballylate:H+ symporter